MISRYVTLRDIMKRFNPEIFRKIAEITGSINTAYSTGQQFAESLGTHPDLKSGSITEEISVNSKDVMQELINECDTCGLPMSKISAQKVLVATAMPGTLGALLEAVAELNTRLEDEMGLMAWFAIEPDKQHFATGDFLFGEAVAEAFPSAEQDIEESARCLAFDRGTACVFHLMRVLESGLYSLADALNIADLQANWQNAIDQIEKAVKALPRSSL